MSIDGSSFPLLTGYPNLNQGVVADGLENKGTREEKEKETVLKIIAQKQKTGGYKTQLLSYKPIGTPPRVHDIHKDSLDVKKSSMLPPAAAPINGHIRLDSNAVQGYELQFADGKIKSLQNLACDEKKTLIFVLKNNKFYAGTATPNKFDHASFFGVNAFDAKGQMIIKDGKILEISQAEENFEDSDACIKVLSQLEKNGIDLYGCTFTSIELNKAKSQVAKEFLEQAEFEKSFQECDDFI